MKGIFIAGTDTDVGKTWIGCQLVEHLQNRKFPVKPRKPVESGCQQDGDQYIASDALRYEHATSGKVSSLEITHFRFKAICSPIRAAELEHQTLTIEQLDSAVRQNITPQKDFVVCEGAGGLFSPIAKSALNIDLIKNLGLPVLLVAEDRLGIINSILLSIEALKHRGIEIKGIVLNRINHDRLYDADNMDELKKYTSLPIISNNKNADFLTQLLSLVDHG